MAFVVGLRVVFGTPSAFLHQCVVGTLVSGCRCRRYHIGLVAVAVLFRGEVHEPLVALLIGKIVLCHKVVPVMGRGLDPQDLTWRGLAE